MDIGDPFPHFILIDDKEDRFDSSALKGLRHVIFFYSKDGSAGCTHEAMDFSALYPKFMLRNIPIIGISKDPSTSHRKFIEKNSLKIRLLSDPDHILMEELGIWGAKMMYGKEVQGVKRSTFIIGKDGNIEALWTNVKVNGHAEKVLEKAISLTKAVNLP